MQFDLAKNIFQQAIAEQGHRPGKKSGFKEKFESPQKLVQAACVLPTWWRTEAKLAIVFTYFFLLSFFLRLLLFTHLGDTPEGEIDTEIKVQAHH